MYVRTYIGHNLLALGNQEVIAKRVVLKFRTFVSGVAEQVNLPFQKYLESAV